MLRFATPTPRSSSAAVVFLFAALSLSAAEAVEVADDSRERQLLEHIEAVQAREGPYSPALLEPLESLALLYDESGDRDFALVALERALQVVRVNRGLHTLEQVPLVRQKIRHEEARGNHAEAWALEQGLLSLIRRHADDLRTAPMLRDIADRQMATLRGYLAGQKTPEVVLGCYYKQWPTTDGGSCTAGSRKTVVQGMLADAQRNYADAITVMLEHGLYGSEELRELEMQLLTGVELVRSLYEQPGEYSMAMVPAAFRADSIEPWRSRMGPLLELAGWGAQYSTRDEEDAEALRRLEARHASLMLPYTRGRQSLRRLYAYEAASSASPLVQAEALAAIADWDLLYSHNGLAVDEYELAHARLRHAGASAEAIERLFAPAIPVVLPAFKANPLAADDTRPATGHIDVAFTITKYGRARDVEIRGAVNATAEAQVRLARLIASNRFRPRLTDGAFADATEVAFRYYVLD